MWISSKIAVYPGTFDSVISIGSRSCDPVRSICGSDFSFKVSYDSKTMKGYKRVLYNYWDLDDAVIPEEKDTIPVIFYVSEEAPPLFTLFVIVKHSHPLFA